MLGQKAVSALKTEPEAAPRHGKSAPEGLGRGDPGW